MIRAKIDPGSAVVAVLIHADAAPPYVTRYIDARTFDVGTVETHDPPIVMRYADKTAADGTVTPGGTWLKRYTRTVTEADERDVSIAVRAYLAGRVEEVMIERVSGAHGKTAAEVASKSAQLVKTARIAARIAAGCESLGIKVVDGPLAVSWRARLAPLVREHGGDVAGPAIKGESSALDPVLAALIEGWQPTTVDHIRVCGGMALWSSLPPLPGAKRRASGPRRPRVAGGVKRPAKGGKAARYPKGARAWGRLSPEERERVQGVERARVARLRERERGDRPACDCRVVGADGRRPAGRCKRSCAAFVAKAVAMCPRCHRPIAAHARPCG